MKHVFLSHSRAAAELVEVLRQQLDAAGFGVIVATEPASDPTSTVVSAIRRADVVVAVLVDQNANVTFEIGMAAGAGKPVVLIGDAERIPTALNSLRFLRMSHDHRSTAIEVVRTVRALTTPHAGAASTSEATADKIESMSPREFETFVGDQFERLGFSITRVGQEDYGVDLLLSAPTRDEKWVVEVKKLARQGLVSVMHIRQLADVVDAMKATAGILVSSSGFTPSATELASNVGVPMALLTIAQLMDIESKGGVEALLKR